MDKQTTSMNGAPIVYPHHMPSRLKRYHTFGQDNFVTFSCYQRLLYLNNDHARVVFLDYLERFRERHRFHIYGYVLIPERVHLLLSEPPEMKLSGVFRALKTETQNNSRATDRTFGNLTATTSASSPALNSPKLRGWPTHHNHRVENLRIPNHRAQGI